MGTALRFNTTLAKLDWFDDYSAVINNVQLAARVARKGNCKGLLFDIEHLPVTVRESEKVCGVP